MSRFERKSQHTQVTKAGDAGSGNHVVQSEVFDDQMLPPADELAKLKAIDPSIVGWVLARTEQEQNFRHATITMRNEVAKEAITRELDICSRSLNYAFFAMIGFLGFAVFMVLSGLVVVGSIIGIADVAAAIIVLIKRSRFGPGPTDGAPPDQENQEAKPSKKNQPSH